MTTLISTNPYTLEVNATFETITREELDKKIILAHEAYLSWKNVSKTEKKALFLKLAHLIEANREELATIQTKEMGMLYSASFAGL